MQWKQTKHHKLFNRKPKNEVQISQKNKNKNSENALHSLNFQFAKVDVVCKDHKLESACVFATIFFIELVMVKARKV